MGLGPAAPSTPPLPPVTPPGACPQQTAMQGDVCLSHRRLAQTAAAAPRIKDKLCSRPPGVAAAVLTAGAQHPLLRVCWAASSCRMDGRAWWGGLVPPAHPVRVAASPEELGDGGTKRAGCGACSRALGRWRLHAHMCTSAHAHKHTCVHTSAPSLLVFATSACPSPITLVPAPGRATAAAGRWHRPWPPRPPPRKSCDFAS